MLAKTVKWCLGSLIAALVLLASMAACSTPKFPYGTYVSADGSSEMHFRSDGTYTAYDGGLLVDQGTFTIQGSQIHWLTSTDCYPQGKGIYSWTYRNATLVMKASGADSCPGRQSAIDSVQFHPKP